MLASVDTLEERLGEAALGQPHLLKHIGNVEAEETGTILCNAAGEGWF